MAYRSYSAMRTSSYHATRIIDLYKVVDDNNSSLRMSDKRKASSPCVSSKGKAKILDSNTTFDSLNSEEMGIDESMEKNMVDEVTVRVLSRNGEKFVGALNRPQAFSIWKKAMCLNGALVSGIALDQSADRPFLIIFHLHEDVDLDEVKDKFSILIEEAEFICEKVVPKPPPPKLGENVTICVPKTRFKLRPYQVDQWISRFGVVVKPASYIDPGDLPGITTDDITIEAKLRKHIPGILPAFGRKMLVRYPGQPIVCGQCFDIGHLRAKCTNEKVEWAAYVKLVLREKVAPIELLGTWSRLIE